MIASALFYVFAAVLLMAALGVITARNPVHSALFLVLAFFNSAVLWLLVEAEFLAIALVLVYVGAVMVLFLFVVMMLDVDFVELKQGFLQYLPLASVLATIVVVELIMVVAVWSAPSDAELARAHPSPTVKSLLVNAKRAQAPPADA